MKNIVLTLLVSTLISTMALSQHQHGIGGKIGQLAQKCLQVATNADLLNEINRRMSPIQQPPINEPSSGVVNVLVCESYRLHVTETNLQTGELHNASYDLGSSTQCSEIKSTLEKILAKDLIKNKLSAVCESYRLHTFLVNTEKKISKTATKDYGSSSQCAEAAAQINK